MTKCIKVLNRVAHLPSHVIRYQDEMRENATNICQSPTPSLCRIFWPEDTHTMPEIDKMPLPRAKPTLTRFFI